jgi:hypothetical protein
MPLPSEGEKTGVLKPGADNPGTTRRAPIPDHIRIRPDRDRSSRLPSLPMTS